MLGRDDFEMLKERLGETNRILRVIAENLELQNNLISEQNVYHAARNRTLKENSLPPLKPTDLGIGARP